MIAANLRVTVTGGVFAALLLSNVPDARACTCVRPPPPREALAEAAAVFEGKVTSISTTPVPGSYPQLLEVEFEVTQVWKGQISRKAILRTATNDAACGIPFTVGTLYLVYAHDQQQTLLASLCSRTAASAAATEDLAALGPSHPPVDSPNPAPTGTPPPASPAPSPTPDPNTGCAVSGTAPAGSATTLIATIALLLLQRRRPRT
jgi:hypothetical protein